MRRPFFEGSGERDHLYEDNLHFRDLAGRLGVPLTWQSDPAYEHTWDSWDLRIQAILDGMELAK